MSYRTILVTGSQGFLGRNLTATLRSSPNGNQFRVLEFDQQNDTSSLKELLTQTDFVFHLAGVNRPNHPEEFVQGNSELTRYLVNTIEQLNKPVPIVFSSSIQASLGNAYGESKASAEQVLWDYSKRNSCPVFIYRLTNIFGKWSRPNYNSVIATFCHNIARDLPIQISDPNHLLQLSYVDDVIETWLQHLKKEEPRTEAVKFYSVPVVHERRLGEIAELIRSFKKAREDLALPNLGDPFIKKLYSTYLSFLPCDQFSYPLLSHFDPRGSFTEFLRTSDRGQVSINVSKPGIVRGNHWHHTKNEKFLVVSGCGEVRFRKIGTEEVLSYPVSGGKLTVVDIPTGYTHSIVNTGDTDLVTVMWVNEPFDREKPDTFPEPV